MKQEIDEAFQNLEKCGFSVDTVITHTAPSWVCERLADYLIDDPTCKVLDEIEKVLRFKKWYFGHFHQDQEINDRFVALYNEVRLIHI